MFRAHIQEMLRAGRYVAGGSHVLDYGRVGRREELRARRFVETGPRASRFV